MKVYHETEPHKCQRCGKVHYLTVQLAGGKFGTGCAGRIKGQKIGMVELIRQLKKNKNT